MKKNDNRILAFNTAKLIESSELQELEMAAGSVTITGRGGSGGVGGGDVIFDANF